MIKKLLFAAIGIALVYAVYRYTRKKKEDTENPYGPLIGASPAPEKVADSEKVAETAQALKMPVEEATVIENRRNYLVEVAAASKNADVKPPATVAETVKYNGKTIPVLGYEREKGSGQTMVMIPFEHTPDFTGSTPTGTLSRSVAGKVTINTGKYAGTWNAWYIYTNPSWATRRANVYIDAKWKE